MKTRHIISAFTVGAMISSAAINAFASPSVQAQLGATPTASSPATAATPNTTSATPPSLVPPAPDLNASGYVLMDANSGQIVASKNPDQRMAPASLTKLMTLFLTEKALASNEIHLTDNVKISETAWKTGGSRMFVKVGTEVPVQDLIQGVIVASGNDATMALAEYVGGSVPTFVAMMNSEAQALGMVNTHFSDPTGLPAVDHYSTPHDLAILARAIINDYPQYYHFFSDKWIDYNHIKQPNRNRLLWRDPSVDGLKTGHTDAAGYCLITSAVRNGVRFVSVVMGTPTDSARANESEALLNYGFRFFTTKKIVAANTSVARPRVWYGKSDFVDLGSNQDIYITLPISAANQINTTITLNSKEFKAPITQGQQYGVLTITGNSGVIQQVPLVALQSDPKAGFFSRLWGHLAFSFHHWFT